MRGRGDSSVATDENSCVEVSIFTSVHVQERVACVISHVTTVQLVTFVNMCQLLLMVYILLYTRPASYTQVCVVLRCNIYCYMLV